MGQRLRRLVLLCAELSEHLASRHAKEARVSPLPPGTPRPRAAAIVRPVPRSAFARPSAGKAKAPVSSAVERRLAMLRAMDKAEAMAKSMTAAGKLTGPESRLVALQIEQVRRDVEAIR